jgi:hypothetical protein
VIQQRQRMQPKSIYIWLRLLDGKSRNGKSSVMIAMLIGKGEIWLTKFIFGKPLLFVDSYRIQQTNEKGS